MTHRDIRIGLIGLVIGLTLGIATAVTGSESALEGKIFRRSGTQRPDTTQLRTLQTHVRRALRK